MAEKESKKIKILILLFLVLDGVGGANIAAGIYRDRLPAIVFGMFCSTVSSLLIIKYIDKCEELLYIFTMKCTGNQIYTGWIKVTPETMPPDMEPVIVTAFHEGFVEGAKESEKDVFTNVRWNKRLQTWEIKEWNICQFEWTTWHDLKVTNWMPMPDPEED